VRLEILNASRSNFFVLCVSEAHHKHSSISSIRHVFHIFRPSLYKITQKLDRHLENSPGYKVVLNS